MSVAAALVLYLVVWFVVLFVTLPIGRRTQGEEGEVAPGTPQSAPANFNAKRTLVIVSVIAFAVWAVVAGIIVSGWISVRDFDVRGILD